MIFVFFLFKRTFNGQFNRPMTAHRTRRYDNYRRGNFEFFLPDDFHPFRFRHRCWRLFRCRVIRKRHAAARIRDVRGNRASIFSSLFNVAKSIFFTYKLFRNAITLSPLQRTIRVRQSADWSCVCVCVCRDDPLPRYSRWNKTGVERSIIDRVSFSHRSARTRFRKRFGLANTQRVSRDYYMSSKPIVLYIFNKPKRNSFRYFFVMVWISTSIKIFRVFALMSLMKLRKSSASNCKTDLWKSLWGGFFLF